MAGAVVGAFDGVVGPTCFADGFVVGRGDVIGRCAGAVSFCDVGVFAAAGDGFPGDAGRLAGRGRFPGFDAVEAFDVRAAVGFFDEACGLGGFAR